VQQRSFLCCRRRRICVRFPIRLSWRTRSDSAAALNPGKKECALSAIEDKELLADTTICDEILYRRRAPCATHMVDRIGTTLFFYGIGA